MSGHQHIIYEVVASKCNLETTTHLSILISQPIEPIVRIIYALIETAIKKNISKRILLLLVLSFCEWTLTILIHKP